MIHNTLVLCTEIRSRQKREFVVQKKVSISIQLGLEFDGFRQYENVSWALPEYGELTVAPNPTIHTFDGIRTHASTDVYLNLTVRIKPKKLGSM